MDVFEQYFPAAFRNGTAHVPAYVRAGINPIRNQAFEIYLDVRFRFFGDVTLGSALEVDPVSEPPTEGAI